MKAAAYAVSLASVAVGPAAQFYVFAQLAWLCVVAFDFYKPYESPAEAAEAAKAAEAEGEEQDAAKGCPPELRAIADASYALVEKNVEGEESCDGKKWKTLIADEGKSENDKITVETCSYPGLSIKRWRVKTKVFGTLKGIATECFDYNYRCGENGWDVSVMRGETVTEFDDPDAGYGVAVYATAPAAGGAVSSRELIDVRYVNWDTPKNGLTLTNVSIDKPHYGTFVTPKGDSSLVRATSHPGGGSRLSACDPSLDPETPQWYDFTLASNIELNGWLLTSIINSATSDALYGSTKELKKHLKTKWPLPSQVFS